MPPQRYNPPTVAPPVGGYSHAVEVPAGSRLLFISGQIPERADGTVPQGFEAQCHAIWDNITCVLDSAGLGTGDLVKVTTFLTDPAQADSNGRIRRERLGTARPALTVVAVRTLESRWLLEIEAIAVGAG